jgi:hypothetical protein
LADHFDFGCFLMLALPRDQFETRVCKNHYNGIIIQKGIFMIKLIAWDMVGVLVREKDLANPDEAKAERLFGANESDDEVINFVKSMGYRFMARN